MSRLRIHAFSISLDGFGGGPRQDVESGEEKPSDRFTILVGWTCPGTYE